MIKKIRFLPPAALLLLSACATIPTGPSVMVLPGSGKAFSEFRVDDVECRQYAQDQAGGSTAQQAANDSAVKSGVVGTVVGAAIGAAIDGRSGAAVGAGTGLLFGSVAGAEAGWYSGYSLQQRYDIGYVQCMYAKGNSVPMSGRLTQSRRTGAYPVPPPPPPSSHMPPPPPSGMPPPPPPPD